ncbi:MAG: sugar ABC transporter ATP-binding protein [Lachnospiraceae bacterium]|nr:sugar ABC transporter ATP-binding protein [Lachnospiraceae bacterium]
MKNILEIRNISKTFGTHTVLADVSMDVRAGEIHALCGENGAGKSTLMNVTAGIIKRDCGDIIFDGKKVDFGSAREAVTAGIAFVHQELALCQHLSVAENMWMWDIPRHMGIIDQRELYRKTDEILKDFNADFSADSKVYTLSVAQQQIAEIAKALSLNAKLIILDEPTSSLTGEETDNLFRLCRKLREQGIGIIYISHRMDEIFSLCDRVSVLRDGYMILTDNIVDTDEKTVITSMVGREISAFYPPKASGNPGEELLRVEHFTGRGFNDISFSLRKGRILGFAGLIGAGRSELMQAIVGLGGYKSGELYVRGEKMHCFSIIPDSLPLLMQLYSSS